MRKVLATMLFLCVWGSLAGDETNRVLTITNMVTSVRMDARRGKLEIMEEYPSLFDEEDWDEFDSMIC